MTAQFKLAAFDYGIEVDPACLVVKETDYPIKVRYQGPFFYCDATVECVVPAGEKWELAFLQTCDAIELRHTYASGNYTRWEFVTPISDSTTKSFPFYSIGAPVQGNKNQVGVGARKVAGPRTAADHYQVQLSMNDNLNSNVQWWDPVVKGHGNFDAAWAHELTKIERKQKFSTFLVAYQGPGAMTSGAKVLAKVIWRMHFSIDFDCSQPPGRRGTKKIEEGHIILYHTTEGSGLKLPAACFVNTNANATQKLVGYNAQGIRKEAQINW